MSPAEECPMRDPDTDVPERSPLASYLSAALTPRRAAALTIALGVVLFTDVLKVFLPSLITLFGQAGSTPPERMGLFAALWFAIPFAAIPVARLTGPRAVLLGGAAVLCASRLALQEPAAGPPQLYLAGTGVTAALVFLYGCARIAPRRAVPAGLAGGLAAAGVVHLALDQVDLVWRDGPLIYLVVVLVCVVFLVCAWHVTASGDLAPAGVWGVLGPVVAIHGMLLTLLGLADRPGTEQAGPWQVAVVAGALVAAQFLLVSFAVRPPRPAWVMAVLLPVAAGALLPLESPLIALLAAPALGACLGTAGLPRAGGPARGGVALLGGMLVFLVAVFLYYAAYDVDLGFPNAVVPAVLGALVGLVAARAARRGSPGSAARPRPYRLAVVAAVTAVTVAALTWRPLPEVRPVAGPEFTLIAYNIRMGFGLSGTLDLDKIADWARGERPDVVLLSEVDRGWLLNGGHDDLARIARGLGMRYHFAPAADALWGDALLTGLPVRQITSHPLGRHDYPTGAQAQAAVVEVGGQEVGIVNTHLQAPAGQAPEVAAIARDLARGATTEAAGTGGAGPAAGGTGEPVTRRVLLAGDLNVTKDSPEMRVLEDAGLTDPLVGLGDPPTSPADDPVERIDHVLLGAGLTAVSAKVPRVPYSDHLPVVVRVRLSDLPQAG
ncbi:endonuclease/exonuclease/phosphatase family protein [Sphaerisporangium sp. B11E5]|uniref:endonuclease/exonuclease/phosphatase family protein n=1 Tax=Sphaerisporangium sp. B11E5 TaxID=3153563 RepID=UPI00325F90B3